MLTQVYFFIFNLHAEERYKLLSFQIGRITESSHVLSTIENKTYVAKWKIDRLP